MPRPASKRQRTDRSLEAASQIHALKARIAELRGNIRGMLISEIIDLEIAAGTKRENERADMILTLSDQRRYPEESLRELKRVLVGVLNQRTAKDLPPEPVPERVPDYIQ